MITVHLIIIKLISLGLAKPQVPVPFPVPFPGLVHVVPGPPQPVPVGVLMPVPGPPHPVPVGVPVPVPVGVAIAISETTTTTTTTTCRPAAVEPEEEQPTIKIYVPWPPYQWPNQTFSLNMPPQMPYRLVPPVFPMPMPMPVPAPPPVVMIPIPPMINIEHRRPNDRRHSDEDSCDSDSSSSSSDESDESDTSSNSSENEKNKKKKIKKSYGIYRSNRRIMNAVSSEEEIKPVLTYQSENGDIKLGKQLSMKEASSLVENARRSEKNVQVMVGKDINGKPNVMIVADDGKSSKVQRRTDTALNNTPQFSIGNGHKELVFKVPDNNTISNLTVSFNIKR